MANSILLSLSGSNQVQPMYWLNPKKGVQYLVNVRAPQHTQWIPHHAPSDSRQRREAEGGTYNSLPTWQHSGSTSGPPIVNHYNVMPVIDVLAGANGRDLGGVLRDIKPLIVEAEKELSRGNFIILRGQAQTMNSSFVGLGLGLLMATALIYLLLVVNFQSWLDPFIILAALPGALAGVVWGLYLSYDSQRSAADGAIMSLGVATANSVLVVTFAPIISTRG